MSVLDGITDFDRDEADYLEDALAFEWLESKGAGKVKSFCRGLAAGKPHRELWAEFSGMDYDEAIAQADAYCRKRVSEALGASHEEIVRLRDAHRDALNAGEASTKRWLAIGGEAELERWIAENSEHPAEPFARFCLARSFARVGRGEESRELLQQILDEDCLRCTLLDDAQFWIGVSYNWAGDHARAGQAFGVLLRDFPSSHSAKQVRGKSRPAGPVTE